MCFTSENWQERSDEFINSIAGGDVGDIGDR